MGALFDGVLCLEGDGLVPTWEVVALLGSATGILECEALVSEGTALFFAILTFFILKLPN